MILISSLVDRRFTSMWAALLSVILVPAVASGQQGSGIAGLVTDGTGGVLPGVVVEARSPALIEGVRSALTDGAGRYSIEALRPGVYSVTFALTGFGTHVREGIELRSGFTAPVDAQLMVSAFQETVTVAGASPVVDVRNSVEQKVFTNETLTALPTASQAPASIVAPIPGTSGVGEGGGAHSTA